MLRLNLLLHALQLRYQLILPLREDLQLRPDLPGVREGQACGWARARDEEVHTGRPHATQPLSLPPAPPRPIPTHAGSRGKSGSASRIPPGPSSRAAKPERPSASASTRAASGARICCTSQMASAMALLYWRRCSCRAPTTSSPRGAGAASGMGGGGCGGRDRAAIAMRRDNLREGVSCQQRQRSSHAWRVSTYGREAPLARYVRP